MSDLPPIPRRRFLRHCLTGVLAPCLVGCGSDPGGPDEGAGDAAPPWRLGAEPGSPAVDPERGLHPLGLGGSRDGLLFVPESYVPDRPIPLFVGLHGHGGRARDWQSYPERARERGMAFLAVDSRAVTWDALRGGYGADVRFLDRALRHTFERCAVDPDRIALGGFSDGASYALSLGIANGGLFSHVVAYSPGFALAPPEAGPRPPIFISHGVSDGILPAWGSRRETVPGLRRMGYQVTFVEFDGGHEVPAEISERALDWFLGVEAG